MITGNPMIRQRKAVDTTSPEAYALSFRCWETAGFTDASNSSPPGVGRYDTINLPNKKCPAGIRANIFFPSCWNGKDLNPPDHAVRIVRVDCHATLSDFSLEPHGLPYW